ncbi:MAG: hypothetical protein GC190_09370 [Alphaproteobacteria bacterium]|nr:hypothetical protein [Alphaproteobacteria bacterium]
MRKSGLVIASLALAAFSASSATAAESLISNPTAVIDTLDVTTVGEMLAEIGAQRVETSEEGDKKLIRFYNGEVPFIAAVALCDLKPGKCLGLAEVTVMQTSANITLDVINKYNSDNLFMAAFKLDDNRLGFGRVVIVDGGITRQNLAINLAGFVVGIPEAVKQLQGQLTSSLQRSNPRAAAAMANIRFTPVQADPRHARFVADQLMAQYKALLTRGIRH